MPLLDQIVNGAISPLRGSYVCELAEWHTTRAA